MEPKNQGKKNSDAPGRKDGEVRQRRGDLNEHAGSFHRFRTSNANEKALPAPRQVSDTIKPPKPN